MPVVINKGKASSSNKHKTAPKMSFLNGLQSHYNTEAPQPFIDRLSVAMDVPAGQDGADIWSAYWLALQAGDVLVHATKKSKGYNRAHRLPLGAVADSTKWPLIEVKWVDNRITRLRIDFIPVDLGHDGMLDLHIALLSLVPDGWEYFVRHGHVTRVDIAVDFPDLAMGDFHVLPQLAATMTTWSRQGHLETVQIGKSTGNQTVIYDRGAKRLVKGSSGQGKTGVRVECRHRTPKILLKHLDQLKDPFSKIDLILASFPKPAGEPDHRWLQFTCTVSVIGMQSALATVPEVRRQAYRKHLKQHSAPWWKPVTMWKLWLKHIEETGISNPDAWL